MSQALDASSRVLKKRAAHSHLSMRVPVMDLCLLLYFLLHDRFYARLDGAQQAAGEIEECGDKLECATDYDSDEAEGKEDQPDERIEEERREGQGPTEDHEDQKEQKVEHSCFSPG